MQELGLTEIILRHAPYPSRASILLFSHPESPQGAQSRVAAAADSLIAATSFAY